MAYRILPTENIKGAWNALGVARLDQERLGMARKSKKEQRIVADTNDSGTNYWDTLEWDTDGSDTVEQDTNNHDPFADEYDPFAE